MSTHAPLLRLDTLSFSATTTSPSPHPPLQPPHNNMACMCWMPAENFKQLTVSPLRPGRCPSTAACIKTHKKPAPFLHVFSPSYPATPPGLPPVSLQATTQTPLDPSHSPSIYTPTSPPSKLDYCSQELSPVDLTLSSSATFFSLRLEVLFRSGLAQGGRHKILTVCFMCSPPHPTLPFVLTLSVHVCKQRKIASRPRFL